MKVSGKGIISWTVFGFANDNPSVVFNRFKDYGLTWILSYAYKMSTFFWRIRAKGRVIMWEINGLLEDEAQWWTCVVRRSSWGFKMSRFDCVVAGMIKQETEATRI